MLKSVEHCAGVQTRTRITNFTELLHKVFNIKLNDQVVSTHHNVSEHCGGCSPFPKTKEVIHNDLDESWKWITTKFLAHRFKTDLNT